MDVANPIYDVVLTYLMQNQRVARLLIGRITGLAVQSLTVSPKGTALRRTPEDPEHDLPLTLLRMTFAARVQTRDGSEQQVLIEILKAYAQTVIERFRGYLAQRSPAGTPSSPSLRAAPKRADRDDLLPGLRPGWSVGRSGDRRLSAGDRAAHGAGACGEHPLVEGIHHRSHIIQIPRLASRRRDELERVLAIFDQGLVKGNGRGDAHVLTIEEGEYPAECAFVLRQLREAMAEDAPTGKVVLGQSPASDSGDVRPLAGCRRPALPGSQAVIGRVVTPIVERFVDMDPRCSWNSALGHSRMVGEGRCERELPTLRSRDVLRQTYRRTIIPVLAYN